MNLSRLRDIARDRAATPPGAGSAGADWKTGRRNTENRAPSLTDTLVGAPAVPWRIGYVRYVGSEQINYPLGTSEKAHPTNTS
jgi:hypothetical protein